MIERRGRSADSRRVALAVDARRDSPKSSSCSRAARTWAARARSRESSRTLVNFVHNYRKQRSGIPLHVYDLGLLPREVRTLRKQAGVV